MSTHAVIFPGKTLLDWTVRAAQDSASSGRGTLGSSSSNSAGCSTGSMTYVKLIMTSIDTGIGPDLELTSRLRYDMLRGSIKPSRLGSRPCILAMSNSTSQFQLPLWLENLLLDKCTPSFLNYLSLLVFVPQV